MHYMYRKSRHVSVLLILAIIFQGFPLMIARAQDNDEVRNVRFTVSGKVITIMYDLQGDAEREYKIGMTLHRKSDDSLHYTPVAVKGDIGEGCRSGNNKQITWNMAKEYRRGLEGDDFYFVIKAELVPEQSSTWLYIAGGAAVVGGVVAYLLIRGGGETSSVDQGFPRPIGRPVH
jgi:hypothetical protein